MMISTTTRALLAAAFTFAACARADDPAPVETTPAPVETPDPAKDSRPEDSKPVDPKGAAMKEAAKAAAAAPQPQASAVADSPGKAILRQAAAAVKAARSLSFRVKVGGEGGIIAGAPGLDAKVQMRRSSTNPNAWIIHAKGSGTGTSASKDGSVKGGDSSEFEVVWTEATVQWVDHAAKTVFLRPTSEARGKALQTANNARLRYFNLPNPFQTELIPNDFTIEDEAEVNGVSCEVVTQSGKRGTKDRYSVGKSDHMPRRVEKIFDSDRVTGRFSTDFTEFKVDDELGDDVFKIAIPDGYKEDVQASRAIPAAPAIDKDKEGATKVDTPAESATISPATPIVPAAPVLRSAPDVDLPLVSGTVKLSSLRGSVVVLDFFGTWAISAKGIHEEFAKSVEKYKDKGVRFISCSVREANPANASEYFTTSKFTWDLAKKSEPAAAAFNIRTYPHWVVVDKDGNIALDTRAAKSEISKLDEAVDKALGLASGTPASAAPDAGTSAAPATSAPAPAQATPPASGDTPAANPIPAPGALKPHPLPAANPTESPK